MTDAYAEIRKQYGLDMVYFLSENAEDVVAGNMLAAEPPERIRKKKKLFGLFGS